MLKPEVHWTTDMPAAETARTLDRKSTRSALTVPPLPFGSARCTPTSCYLGQMLTSLPVTDIDPLHTNDYTNSWLSFQRLCRLSWGLVSRQHFAKRGPAGTKSHRNESPTERKHVSH